jgi:hypothetical protein
MFRSFTGEIGDLARVPFRSAGRRHALSFVSIVAAALVAGLLFGSAAAGTDDVTPFFPYKPKDVVPALQEQTAKAGGLGELQTGRFDIAYVEPVNPAHDRIHALMKEERILEKVQALLAPVKLPLRITLKLEGCHGVVNATFWEDAIKVCYEYIEYIWKQAGRATARELSPRDAVIGPTIDVFLHEAGHAVLEILDIPFFGREEEVADYFATYIMLQLCKDDARRLILGASFLGGRETIEEQNKVPELRLLAATHSLPAQRYFNRWCMAYGANPVLFGDAVGPGMLPESRAKHCRYEYQTNAFAFKTLISPYIDEELKQEVLAREWFESPAAGQMCSEKVAMPAPDRSPGVRPETAPGLHPDATIRQAGQRNYAPAMPRDTQSGNPTGLPRETPPQEKRDEAH